MKYNREIYWEGRIKMKKELFRRVGCIVLAVIMALSILGTNMQLTVRAEEPGEWKEVTVPDGDFESGETTNNSAWEFTGDIDGDNYFYKLYKNSYMKNNTTFVYQASSKKGTNITKEYKAAQTVTVPNGIYKASVDASGASEKGTHTTTLSAGGKSVAITPSVWDVWETYTTDQFVVTEGFVEIELNSTVTGQYIEMDNVRLFRLIGSEGEMIVDKVLPQQIELAEGDTFTAPAKATVRYTDGTEHEADVTWNEQELAEVVTTKPATFTVEGTVTVGGTEHRATLIVTVMESPKWSFHAFTDKDKNVVVVTLQNLKSDITEVAITASIFDSDENVVDTKSQDSNIAQGETASLVFRSEHLKAVGDGGYTFSASVKSKNEDAVLPRPIVELETDDAPLVNKNPETFCNPINISYPYQSYSSHAFRMLADAQPVYYKGEYWMFPTKASGYFHSKDLINWEFIYSVSNQTNSNAPGTFVYNDYLYIGRYDAKIYRSNDPANPDSWEVVRNTNYPDPYFFLDTDKNGKEHLYVLHGCTGLNASNTDTEPIVYLMELDLTSPTLAELPVDTAINAKAVNGKGYPIIYMEREQHGYEVPGQMNDNYDPNADSWLEGAGMIKYNDKYYVYYSGPSTECAAYGEGCYVSDSPFGPYQWCDSSPFAYKSTGFTVGAGHGHDVVEQTSGRIWKFGSVCVPNYYHWERRMNLYPVDFNEYDQPVTDMSVSDYPMYVPTSAKSTFETQGPGWNLVSYGMTAEASSTYDADVTPTNKDPEIAMMDPFHISVEKAFDESMRTWWSAETGNEGEWIKGDMGKVKTVNALQLNFADQDTGKMNWDARKSTECYRYLIEYSTDGTTWLPLVDRSNYTAEAYKAQDTSHDYFEFVEPVSMRYIRVTNKGKVPAKGKFAISGLRLFGNGNGEEPEKLEDFTLTRIEGADGRSVQVSWEPVLGAEGYIIRYGTHKDQMNIHHQAIGTTSARINALTANQDYYFRVDTYNDSGRTIGTTVKKLDALTVEATGVTLDKTSLELEAGASETLKAQLVPANATNRRNTWESSAPEVASVNNGTVTARNAGEAIITVTTANGQKAECKVTVTEREPGPSDYTVIDGATGEIRWDLAGFASTVTDTDTSVSQTKYADLSWLAFSTAEPVSYWMPDSSRIEMYGGYIAFTPPENGTLYVTGASKKDNNGRYISVVTDYSKPDTNKIIVQSDTLPVERSAEVEKGNTYYIVANGAYITQIRYVPAPAQETPEEKIEKARKEIQIPNKENIRGNITLLSETSNGVKVSWKSSDEAIVSTKTVKHENYDDTPAGVVTRDQNEDKKVTLTATLTLGELTETEVMVLTVKKAPEESQPQDYKGYLFVSFTGEDTADGEQIYFSISKDGFHWEDLNDNEPVLISTLGEKGVRDPFIMRSAEGDRFYLIATDLKINGKGKGVWNDAVTKGSKSIMIWESDDLVHWSDQRMVEVAVDNAGCTWAPEFIYDEKTGEYFVYWASNVQNAGETKALQKVYYAKTRDFYTFTEPKLYISKSDHILDTTIIKEGEWYYRISNDDTAKRIKIDRGKNLLGSLEEFEPLDTPALDTLKLVEGPTAFKLNGTDQWCLMVDRSGADLGYLPLVTDDLSTGVFRILDDSEFSMGAKKRHGSVINLTQEEYDAVMKEWGNGLTGELDKTALHAKIAEAEAKDASVYTPETWKILEEALNKAKAAAENEEATQSQIDEAAGILENAIQGLEEKQDPPEPAVADKTVLYAKITEAEGKEASGYTADSFQNLADALKAAKEISGNKEATQKQVDEATEKLENAIKALVEIRRSDEEELLVKKPGTPSSVKASWNGKEKVKITWEEVSDADQYMVYRSYKKSSGYKKLAVVTGLSYTDKNAKNGKTVYYKVIAYKGDQQGSFSKAASAFKLKKPSKIKAKVKRGKVTISFVKSAKASGYQIYRAVKRKGKYKNTATIKAGKTKTVKKTFSKMKKGTYYYKVRAYRSIGKRKIYTAFSKAVKVKVN